MRRQTPQGLPRLDEADWITRIHDIGELVYLGVTHVVRPMAATTHGSDGPTGWEVDVVTRTSRGARRGRELVAVVRNVRGTVFVCDAVSRNVTSVDDVSIGGVIDTVWELRSAACDETAHEAGDDI